jgi:hypothetical protein
LETIYKELFSLGLAKSDLTATKGSFKSKLTSLGVNTAQVDNYISSMQSYLAIVVTNPTEVQKTSMTSKLDAFDLAEKNFIQSFEGLSTIDTDLLFSADPRNTIFNAKRAQSAAAKALLRLNPGGTYGVFTDLSTPRNFATYTYAAVSVSNRIKSEGSFAFSLKA